jgi:LacI family transcriptional regulator
MSTTQPTLSIRDIAKRCGVSPGTVSNVINGRDVVKPETASRIRALMNELNYAPRSKAVNTNRVMLLLPSHHDALLSSHLAAMHAGVCETAFNHNIVLSMQRCPDDLHSANQLRDMLREDGSSGIILLATSHGYHMADTLALSQTPHMVVGASRHQRDVNQIVCDDEASAYRAAITGAQAYFDDLFQPHRYRSCPALCRICRRMPAHQNQPGTGCRCGNR